MRILSGADVGVLDRLTERLHVHSGHYDLRLVATSALVGIFASFCAMEAISKPIRGVHEVLWNFLAALLMGLGIWAMNFSGMAAYQLDVGVHYDPAVADSSAHVPAGLLLGLGIGLMHQAGMSALHFDGGLRFEPRLFALSMVAAAALGVGALWVSLQVARSYHGHLPYAATLAGGVVLALARGDERTAKRIAHTLKGVAGNIGATGIRHAAALLEVALRDRRERPAIDALLAALTPRLSALIAGLQQALPPAAQGAGDIEADGEPTAPLAVGAVRTRLAALLRDDDPAASDVPEEHTILLREAMPGQYDGAVAAVRGFNLGEALAILESGGQTPPTA